VFLLGAGLLLPYNALLTAVDYFKDLYPNANLPFFIPMIMNYPSILIQLFIIRYNSVLSYSGRVLPFFLAQTVIIGCVPLYNGLEYNESLWLTIATIFGIGIGIAVLQATIFGFVGMLPPVFIQALMSGSGFAGLMIGVARLLTQSGYPNDHDGLKSSALIYFEGSGGITLACVFAFAYLARMPFTLQYVNAARPPKPHDSASDVLEIEAAVSPVVSRPAVNDVRNGNANGNGKKNGDSSENEHTALLAAAADEENGNAAPVHAAGTLKFYKQVWSKVWLLILVEAGTFIITFVVFPGVLTDVSSMYIDDGWYSVILIVRASLVP